MANPIIQLHYERMGPFDFSELHRLISGCGLNLVHPRNGVVTRRSEDGEQMPSSLPEVVRLVQERQWVAVDYWADEVISAHVSIRPVNDACACESISMDTLDDALKIAIAKAATARLRSMSGRRMLVVDLFGESLEFIDWDVFFRNVDEPLSLEIPSAVSPTILGIHRVRFDAVAERFRDYSVEGFDEMVLASRPARVEDFPNWRWERYQHLGRWTTVPPTRS